jgi:hypothetical protein
MVFMKYPTKNQHLYNKLIDQFLEYCGELELYINNGGLIFWEPWWLYILENHPDNLRVFGGPYLTTTENLGKSSPQNTWGKCPTPFLILACEL